MAEPYFLDDTWFDEVQTFFVEQVCNARQHLAVADQNKELPVSISQEAYLNSSNLGYCGRAFRLKGPLRLEALQQSLNEIVQRHAVLRTTFSQVEDRWVQSIFAPPLIPLPVVDLTTWIEPAREVEIQRLIIEEARRRFDRSWEVLLRATLLCLGAEDQILILILDHVAADGWSDMVLLQEISALYPAFLAGKPSPLPDPLFQYADFSCWQRHWLQSEDGQRLLSYWEKQFAGLKAMLLPTDHPRSGDKRYQSASQTLLIPNALSESLKGVSRKERVTLFMTLLATFQTLIHRCLDQDEVLVHSYLANRSLPGTQDLIGYFAHGILLRVTLGDDPRFQELLGRVRQAALAAHNNIGVNDFQLLAMLSHDERQLGSRVQFEFHALEPDEFDLPGLTVSPVDFSVERPYRDELGLIIAERSEGLAVVMRYQPALFEASTIKRLLGNFYQLLEAIVADPQQRLSALPLETNTTEPSRSGSRLLFLTEDERQQLLVRWNDTQAEYSEDKCLHELFEAQVERTPDAIAVVLGDKRLTYQELDRRADQLAQYLRKLGVGPEVLVGICMQRSVDMVVGVLGVLKAGGAYVPLDPTYPPRSLALMLEDTQAPVLLTQAYMLERLPSHQARVVCLDADWDQIVSATDVALIHAVLPDNLAYVIFTSGSTGRPKGVQIRHQAVVNFLEAMPLTLGLMAQDILLSVTTLSFDISILELFLPLCVGAYVVLAKQEALIDAAQLIAQIATLTPTVMQATPATWQMLLLSGWRGNERLKILCGGEALSRELATQLLSRGGSLWNMYGPTETTIWSSSYRVTRQANKSIPIGYPIANTEIYLLDGFFRPVPIGVPGRLYIGGDGLARGYLNHPDLTAERFVPNPFSKKPGTRLYDTGDLACHCPDGAIEYRGRSDFQVKVHGFRIELGEIETVLEDHPHVQKAVAIVREDTPGDKRVAVYYVLKPGHEPTRGDLRGYLQGILPEHIIPSIFVRLDTLPLTPNGKINRRALPQPDNIRSEADGIFVAPVTPLEKEVAEIWAKLLKFDQIGLHDKFLDLGGYSLLATQMILCVRETWQVSVSLGEVLTQGLTIARLVRVIEDALFRQMQPYELEELLQKIEGLSDDEAKGLLSTV